MFGETCKELLCLSPCIFNETFRNFFDAHNHVTIRPSVYAFALLRRKLVVEGARILLGPSFARTNHVGQVDHLAAVCAGRQQ